MADPADSEQRLPLVEERLTIAKRPVVTGRVRVSTVTETVDDLAQAELQGETVEVTRVPVDRIISAAPDIREEGGVTIIPVVQERLVVTTELVLTEEIHIRRSPTREWVELPVLLRRQRAIVERTDPEAPNPKGTDR